MSRETDPDLQSAAPVPPDGGPPDTGARADFEQRIYQRLGDGDGSSARPGLPAPARLAAGPGVGHVRLNWDLVPGAAGYVIERTGPDGAPEILRHGGSDVPAVAGPPFADTGIADGTDYVTGSLRSRRPSTRRRPGQHWPSAGQQRANPGRSGSPWKRPRWPAAWTGSGG